MLGNYIFSADFDVPDLAGSYQRIGCVFSNVEHVHNIFNADNIRVLLKYYHPVCCAGLRSNTFYSYCRLLLL